MSETEVIVVAQPSPVFVDSTGRRSRLLRRFAYGFGALCVVYGGLVSVSLAGGPVSSSAVLPLPDLADADDKEEVVVTRPSPLPEPSASSPALQPVLEALPRGAAPATRETSQARTVRRSPAPSKKPSATPSTKPSATPTSARPLESATTKPAKPSSPAVTPPTGTTAPVAPVPPAPPYTGGQGGGEASGEPTDEPATEPTDKPTDTPTAGAETSAASEPAPGPSPEASTEAAP